MISKKNDTFLHILFVFLALCCILPCMLVVAISLTNESSIIEYGYRFIPKEISFDAYSFMLKDFGLILTSYKNTFIVVIIGTIIKVFIAALYGYAISRRDFPYRGIFSMVILITILFSGGLAPQYYTYVNLLHLKNTYTVMILRGIHLGFDVFMMKSYFASNIPYEIIESGKIDGAGETKIYFKLVLPMAVPILATVGLMTAITYWNDFQTSLLYIEKESLQTLQYTMQRSLMSIEYIKEMASAGVSGADTELAELPTESARMAMAVFAIGPIIFAYPFFQRFFISGLTVGAVKG